MRVTLALVAYNEEDALGRVVRDAAQEMERHFEPQTWEILVIDDGSTDATGDIAEHLATAVTGVRVYHHNPNRGYVEATLSALREARGDNICVFDGDGQQAAADVPRFVRRLEGGCDVVFGWKRQRQDHITRILLSYGLRYNARYFLHTRLHDINAGCRGFRREHVAALSQIRHRINFIGPELYTRARLQDLKICEMEVRHLPREGGVSSHPVRKVPGEVRDVILYLRALRGELQAAGKWRRFL